MLNVYNNGSIPYRTNTRPNELVPTDFVNDNKERMYVININNNITKIFLKEDR